MTGFSDNDAFERISQLVIGSGMFAAVLLGENPAQGSAAAGLYPLCWIHPKSFREDSNIDPENLTRFVTYQLDITSVPSASGTAADVQEAVTQLGSALQNRLNQVSFGPTCIPLFSQLGNGMFNPSTALPEVTLSLAGQFAYSLQHNQRGQDLAFPAASTYFTSSYFPSAYFASILT